MKVTSARFRNYRCLVDVSLDLDDITVLIGENNTGKTAVLDAFKLVTSRVLQRRLLSVDAYDFHMANSEAEPTTASPIIIDLTFSESIADEWSAELVQALTDIVQTDPYEDIDSVHLRFSS